MRYVLAAAVLVTAPAAALVPAGRADAQVETRCAMLGEELSCGSTATSPASHGATVLPSYEESRQRDADRKRAQEKAAREQQAEQRRLEEARQQAQQARQAALDRARANAEAEAAHEVRVRKASVMVSSGDCAGAKALAASENDADLMMQLGAVCARKGL